MHGGLGSAADLAGVEAAGAVLLLDRGVITFAEKALNAEAAGAVAVIIVNNRPGSFRGSLGRRRRRLCRWWASRPTTARRSTGWPLAASR